MREIIIGYICYKSVCFDTYVEVAVESCIGMYGSRQHYYQ